MLEFHVAGSAGNSRAGFWHAKLMLASAMLISRAVCSAQINLRGEFAFGCTPFYAEIMCMIT